MTTAVAVSVASVRAAVSEGRGILVSFLRSDVAEYQVFGLRLLDQTDRPECHVQVHGSAPFPSDFVHASFLFTQHFFHSATITSPIVIEVHLPLQAVKGASSRQP